MNNKKNILKKISALVVMACGMGNSFAYEVAPYFEAWSGSTLTQARANSGLTSATLAFGITNGTCALQSDFVSKLPDARNYVNAGNSLRLSFGGQNGVYAEIACKTDAQLIALLEKVMLDSGTKKLDFDVEGHQLLNTEGTARRSRALKALQTKYPDLYVSFTLPGWLNGLSADSVNLLKNTVSNGVRIDMVNVMAMSWGAENIRTMVSPATLSRATIMTIQASAKQVAAIFPNKSSSQINAMMGMTPMIGINDDATVFTLEDARIVADFAKNNGFGLISYWSFQRDKAQSVSKLSPVNVYSGVVQSHAQFYNTFKSGASASNYVPSPAPTSAPTPAPTAPVSGSVPSTSTQYPAWVQGQSYSFGQIVTYNNKQYRVKVSNPGYNPSISTYYWEPYIVPGSSTTSTPVWSTTSIQQTPAWVMNKMYAAGSIVLYSGKLYIAKVSNPGYNPVISTYYWAPYVQQATTATQSIPTLVPGATYQPGYIISSNGVYYILMENNNNPGTYYWAPYRG